MFLCHIIVPPPSVFLALFPVLSLKSINIPSVEDLKNFKYIQVCVCVCNFKNVIFFSVMGERRTPQNKYLKNIYYLGTYYIKYYNLMLKCILFYLFLEKGREKKRERNINVWLPLMHPLLGTWPATQACALTGNQTSDPLVHKPALNPLNHTSQGIMLKFI